MNMLKWVGRFLFIILVLMATVPVMQYGNYKSYEAFYEDHMEGEELNKPVYFKGLNTILGLDYYVNQPLYQFDQGDLEHVKFNLDVYVIGATDNKTPLNGLLFFLYNVEIKNASNQIIQNPVIKLMITMSHPIRKDSNDQDVFVIEKLIYTENPMYLPVQYLFDMDGELGKSGHEEYQTIQRIVIEHGMIDGDGFTPDDTPLLFADRLATYDGPAHVKVLNFSITPDEYQLREQFASNIPTDEEIISFGLITDRHNLRSYNWIIWRTIIIYVAIVLAIAYFLFFHRAVMERRSLKHIGKSTKNQTVNAEPIFKDPDPNQKDGK